MSETLHSFSWYESWCKRIQSSTCSYNFKCELPCETNVTTFCNCFMSGPASKLTFEVVSQKLFTENYPCLLLLNFRQGTLFKMPFYPFSHSSTTREMVFWGRFLWNTLYKIKISLLHSSISAFYACILPCGFSLKNLKKIWILLLFISLSSLKTTETTFSLFEYIFHAKI